MIKLQLNKSKPLAYNFENVTFLNISIDILSQTSGQKLINFGIHTNRQFTSLTFVKGHIDVHYEKSKSSIF